MCCRATKPAPNKYRVPTWQVLSPTHFALRQAEKPAGCSGDATGSPERRLWHGSLGKLRSHDEGSVQPVNKINKNGKPALKRLWSQDYASH